MAKVCTDVAGSSHWFECGFVTYSNAAKVRDIGVSEHTLANHGAVSEATVREMAAGALRVSGADVAVAISGIAGPDGGTPAKPVGTVWFGLASRRGDGHRRDFGDAALRRRSRAHTAPLGGAGAADGARDRVGRGGVRSARASADCPRVKACMLRNMAKVLATNRLQTADVALFWGESGAETRQCQHGGRVAHTFIYSRLRRLGR